MVQQQAQLDQPVITNKSRPLATYNSQVGGFRDVDTNSQVGLVGSPDSLRPKFTAPKVYAFADSGTDSGADSGAGTGTVTPASALQLPLLEAARNKNNSTPVSSMQPKTATTTATTIPPQPMKVGSFNPSYVNPSSVNPSAAVSVPNSGRVLPPAYSGRAVLLLKPYANNERTLSLITSELSIHKISIIEQGQISAKEMEERKRFENHYAHIRRFAVLTSPGAIKLNSSEEALFSREFGSRWQVYLEEGRILNMSQALDYFGVNSEALYRLWTSADTVFTVKHGITCARIRAPTKEGGSDGQDFILINGHFGQLRDSFIFPGATCRFLVLGWDDSALSFNDFVTDVIGDEDPETASPFSIRGHLYNQWDELGVSYAPDSLLYNFIHVSSSAFETLTDSLVWVKGSILDRDPFVQQLISAGVSQKTIQLWMLNRELKSKGSLIDLCRSKGTDECIDYLKSATSSSH